MNDPVNLTVVHVEKIVREYKPQSCGFVHKLIVINMEPLQLLMAQDSGVHHERDDLEIGHCVDFLVSEGVERRLAVMREVIAHANRCLQPGMYYDIRRKITDDFGRADEDGIAWYTTVDQVTAQQADTDEMSKAPTFLCHPDHGIALPERGFILLGFQKTPE
jgi:hypothetical protein